LVTRGVSEAKITDIEIQARAHVEREAAAALQGHQPAAIFDAKAKLPTSLMVKAEYRGSGDSLAMTMVEAIRETLRNKMAADSHVTLYGEDIEDPKGDVFGVTRGLTDAFPGRVKNSPVSESTIVGTSIGRALVGGRPVAFLQFADFLPLAFNQIATELGSMYWRTNGGWTCPVIIMVACGGYRPGLGPFHAHTFESILTHVPGVDVVMPSTAGDAAGMLNAAFESKRPTIFLYPKACLNDKTRATSADIDAQLVPVGKARTIRSGNDITLVAWGNTVPLCEKVAETLSTIGAAAEVIDLRWLSPWDDDMVCRSARRTGKLIVVHEDNKSSGLGAEVVATVVEHVAEHVECRRITRPDTFVPCHFGNQLDVLPSFRSILTAAAKMLDLDLQWSFADASDRSLVIVEAIGSSPADQTVTVLEVMVTTGQTISEGDPIASIECDKAVFELSAPTGGIVESVFLQDGQEAPVGTPLVGIRAQNNQTHTRQPVRENSGEPHLSRKKDQTGNLRFSSTPTGRSSVVMSNIYPVVGEKSLTNFDLSARFPQFNESDILSRTGISSRSIASEEQTTTAMAVDAALKALQGEKTNLEDIDLIICSTSTPEVISPSVACLVLAEINRAHGKACEIPAYDMLAACTGYLYALKAAWEHVQCNPKSRVLVITTERMSSIIDPYDFGTVALFGDAATATIIGGEGFLPNARVRLYKPVISAFGENGTILTVPTLGNDKFVQMNGKTVFVEAVRRMARILEVACEELGRQVTDLDFVIPHQANGRIIEAVRKRLKVSQSVVRNDIVNRGNTSSSTIPLALSQQSYGTPGQLSGLCAFGAGYTFGAAIIETLK
jgi:2-oxoisovalerate dehydrogenase E1 component